MDTCTICDSPLGYLGRHDGLDLFECTECPATYEATELPDAA